jgi:hypothetical protein
MAPSQMYRWLKICLLNPESVAADRLRAEMNKFGKRVPTSEEFDNAVLASMEGNEYAQTNPNGDLCASDSVHSTDGAFGRIGH